MTSVARAHYVPGGGEAWRSPWATYAALRDHDPVHRVVPDGHPERDFYVLSRHADVLAAATDPATFSSAEGLSVEYGELDRIGLRSSPPMVMTDPPAHTAFRKLVARGFTPRQVTTVEPDVRAFVRERLDRVEDLAAGGAPVDIVGELFKPLPSRVVAHYLGVPPDGRERFDSWTDAIVSAGASGAGLDGVGATGELIAYFAELVELRRRKPGDDTVSELVRAGVGDDDAGLLTILGYVFTMVTGGNDTTTGLLGGAVALLAARPDQRQALADDPALVKDAVEELLRLTSPVQGLARTATRDVTVHDVTIPAGRKVLLLYGSANRDPRRFGPDAEELDIRRRPTQLLTFSQGHHHCLGAAAARMQGRVVLEELLARFPRYVVDEAGTAWAPGPYVRRPVRLPFSPR